MDKFDMSGIKLSGLGALFTDDASDDEIQKVEISRLKAFRNHPYKVLDNKDMDELVESIRERGVIEAVICRKSGNGFEIISGHRRKRACELLGMKTVPAKIVDVSDDEATVYMVDANLRRTTILPSEKAWAYRMKYEAIKHQGKKRDDKGNGSSLDYMAEETNESGTQIKRYIRLTYLNPKLLDMVDKEKIPFSIGAVLSYLDDKSQRDLLELLQEGCKMPSGIQAEQIKNLCQQGKMNKEIMRAIITDCFIPQENEGKSEKEEHKAHGNQKRRKNAAHEDEGASMAAGMAPEEESVDVKLIELKDPAEIVNVLAEMGAVNVEPEDPEKETAEIPDLKSGMEEKREGKLQEEYKRIDVALLLDKYIKDLKEYREADVPEHMIQEQSILVDALTLLLEQY